MSRRSVAVVIVLCAVLLAGAGVSYVRFFREARPSSRKWAERVQASARDARIAEPVPASLASGASARAYAVCFDLASRADRPKECRLSSAFVFASAECAISYRGLDAAHHQGCALECPDGCIVLDGLFAGPVSCDAWRDALSSGNAGCRYELRDGIRLGPDDADGRANQAERDAAQAEIDALRTR